MRNLVIALALLSPLAAAAQDVPSERIAFEAGTDHATINAAIAGREARDYVLGARAGQSMAVRLMAAGVAYFNVLAPSGGAGEAMFVGSREGDVFEEELPEDGDYRVRVYLMGNDRDAGVRVPYRLIVAID